MEDLAVHVPRWQHLALPWSPVWLVPQLEPPAADAVKTYRQNYARHRLSKKIKETMVVGKKKKICTEVSHTLLPPVRGREWLVHRWCLVSWQSQSDDGRNAEIKRDSIVNNIIASIYKWQLFSYTNKVIQELTHIHTRFNAYTEKPSSGYDVIKLIHSFLHTNSILSHFLALLNTRSEQKGLLWSHFSSLNFFSSPSVLCVLVLLPISTST